MHHRRRPDGWHIYLGCTFCELELVLPHPPRDKQEAVDVCLAHNSSPALTNLLRAFRRQRAGEKDFGMPQYWTCICYEAGRHVDDGWKIVDIPPAILDQLDMREWDARARQRDKHHETTPEETPLRPMHVVPGEGPGSPPQA